MADLPILFSAPMVHAILADLKTKTRRTDLEKWAKVNPGDRLWVREAFAFVGTSDPGWPLYRASSYEDQCARYRLDRPYPDESTVRWRPSIHMPRAISRITLEVTAVRVERLQDISEEDARAEGFADGPFGAPMPERPIGGGWTMSSPGGWASAAGHFEAAWCDLYGFDAWDENPEVAVISFQKIMQ